MPPPEILPYLHPIVDIKLSLDTHTHIRQLDKELRDLQLLDADIPQDDESALDLIEENLELDPNDYVLDPIEENLELDPNDYEMPLTLDTRIRLCENKVYILRYARLIFAICELQRQIVLSGGSEYDLLSKGCVQFCIDNLGRVEYCLFLESMLEGALESYAQFERLSKLECLSQLETRLKKCCDGLRSKGYMDQFEPDRSVLRSIDSPDMFILMFQRAPFEPDEPKPQRKAFQVWMPDEPHVHIADEDLGVKVNQLIKSIEHANPESSRDLHIGGISPSLSEAFGSIEAYLIIDDNDFNIDQPAQRYKAYARYWLLSHLAEILMEIYSLYCKIFPAYFEESARALLKHCGCIRLSCWLLNRMLHNFKSEPFISENMGLAGLLAGLERCKAYVKLEPYPINYSDPGGFVDFDITGCSDELTYWFDVASQCHKSGFSAPKFVGMSYYWNQVMENMGDDPS